jgi:hypothetical protein
MQEATFLGTEIGVQFNSQQNARPLKHRGYHSIRLQLQTPRIPPPPPQQVYVSRMIAGSR